ncbi:MAG: hypothetical protein QME78_15475 [Thermodesulfobacteriota bacterium]|nr:hypothetical protein [Thermodesulfobacteriota bacterium]
MTRIPARARNSGSDSAIIAPATRSAFRGCDATEPLIPSSTTSFAPTFGLTITGRPAALSRGKPKKETEDALVPSILEPECSSQEYRKNWARLIQKIGTCP